MENIYFPLKGDLTNPHQSFSLILPVCQTHRQSGRWWRENSSKEQQLQGSSLSGSHSVAIHCNMTHGHHHHCRSLSWRPHRSPHHLKSLWCPSLLPPMPASHHNYHWWRFYNNTNAFKMLGSVHKGWLPSTKEVSWKWWA